MGRGCEVSPSDLLSENTHIGNASISEYDPSWGNFLLSKTIPDFLQKSEAVLLQCENLVKRCRRMGQDAKPF